MVRQWAAPNAFTCTILAPLSQREACSHSIFDSHSLQHLEPHLRLACCRYLHPPRPGAQPLPATSFTQPPEPHFYRTNTLGGGMAGLPQQHPQGMIRRMSNALLKGMGLGGSVAPTPTALGPGRARFTDVHGVGARLVDTNGTNPFDLESGAEFGARARSTSQVGTPRLLASPTRVGGPGSTGGTGDTAYGSTAAVPPPPTRSGVAAARRRSIALLAAHVADHLGSGEHQHDQDVLLGGTDPAVQGGTAAPPGVFRSMLFSLTGQGGTGGGTAGGTLPRCKSGRWDADGNLIGAGQVQQSHVLRPLAVIPNVQVRHKFWDPSPVNMEIRMGMIGLQPFYELRICRLETEESHPHDTGHLTFSCVLFSG